MRRRGAIAAWAIMGVAALVPAAQAPSVHAQTADAPVRLRVLVNPLDVRPGEVLGMIVVLEGSVPEDASVVVRVYDPVTDRSTLRTALAGDAGPTRDRITLALDEIPRTPSGYLDLRIPTTAGPLQRGLLRLPTAGVHPVSIEVRDPATGRPDEPALAEVMTLAHAVGDTTSGADLAVSYVTALTAPPARQPDGSVTFDPAVRDSLTNLVDLMERTEAAFSVALPPEFVEALSTGEDADRALYDRLMASLGTREIIATPAVTLDPATAVRSGLSDTYTTLLRRGEDVISALAGRGGVQRTVQVVNDTLDVGGAVLMRDLGTRSVVVTPRAQAMWDGLVELRDVVDTTSMVSLPLGRDSEMPAALVDPALARRLIDGEGSPSMTALGIVAELLVIRYGTLARLGADVDPSAVPSVLSRRSISLSTPDGRPGRPELLAAVLDRIDATAGLRTVTASQAGATTGLAIANGLTVQLPLPEAAGDDLSARADTLFMLSLDAYTVASMLPEGDPRPTVWSDQVWRLAARDLQTDQVEAGLDLVRRRLEEVRGAVTVPSLSDITLGGRRSTIRLRLRNDATYDIRVAVRLESAKLSFPGGQELVIVPGSSTADVEIPVEVRSNGRFPVAVTLLTPEGDVPLGAPVEFAARATALTGLGQVVTVAGGLVLASWWFRHGRARRRARRAQGVTT